jgi:hypothetical protein
MQMFPVQWRELRSITLSAFVLGSVALAATAARADDPPEGTLVTLTSREVFVPDSYDDNDDAVVVLDGELPNGCYELAETDVKRSPESGAFVITQYARRMPGACIQITIPFFKEVSLGILPAGEFKVISKGVEPQLLTVAEAPDSGPDEVLYAPVETARIERGEDGQRFFAVIQGTLTTRCQKITEVQVLDKDRTIEVVPILERIDADLLCEQRDNPYSWMVELPSDMTEGRHLLHVRGDNGKSVNLVFTVYRD